MIDYYSRFVEIARLSTVTSNDVITQMKSIFACHGISESLTSDNGPQYTADMFKTFAKQYGFAHLTSSPRYPHGNDAAERAVRTVKSLLEKSDDPYVALMSYRSTPLENGYSPAELLMGRKLRTMRRTLKIRDRQQKNFNTHHFASPFKSLNSGDLVYIPNNAREGSSRRISTSILYCADT